MTRSDGLWIFLVITWMRLNGLALDALLAWLKLPTFTDFARRNTWPAYVMIGMEAIGLAGLAFHFFGKNGDA
jgi:hypothetical protein